MKKIISILMSINTFSLFSTNVISCANSYIYDNEVWLITDGGTITDQSFNEYSYKGANEFVANKKYDGNTKYRASYFEPLGNNANDFINAYKTAKVAGAKYSVLSGYKNEPYLSTVSSLINNNIIIDSSNGNNESKEENGLVDGDFSNVIGVSFESEISGFEAGLASYFWLNSEYNTNEKDEYKVGIYGGMDAPTSVNNYMWGIISSIEFFNDYKNGNLKNSLLSEMDNIKSKFKGEPDSSNDLKSVQLVDFQNSQFNDPSKYKYKESNWYSNSYNSGDGVAISDSLLNANANLIMAVAGPQTLDTLNEIQKKDPSTKVIGVDAPQASVLNPEYSNLNNPIITSAEKKTDAATNDILNDLFENDPNKWLGKTIMSPLADNTSDWIGIESTDQINNDVTNAISDLLNVTNESESLEMNLINWYNENMGNSFEDLLSNNKDNKINGIWNNT